MNILSLIYNIAYNLNVWSIIAITSGLYVIGNIKRDFSMSKETKKPLYISAAIVIAIAIIDNLTYYLYGLPGMAFTIKCLYTSVFVLMQIAPFMFITTLDKTFFSSTKGMITGTMMSANITAMVFNLFYPILFDVTPAKEYVTFSLFPIRPIFLLLTYFIVFGDVFKKKYNITKTEESLINHIALIFITGVVFYDIYYSGELISALLGMGLHCIVQIFHMLELKTDLVTGLLNRYVYNNKALELALEKNLTVVSIDLNDLKKINDSMTHDEGDRYLKANARTLNDALSPYGTLYRTGGDEFIFLGRNHEEIVQVLNDLQKVSNVDPKYGYYRLSFAYGAVKKQKDEDVFSAAHRADEIMYENKILVKSRRA